MAMGKYFYKFKSGEDGLIINMSSVLGVDPTHLLTTYSSTKSAIISLGRSLGNDIIYNQYKTKFLTICPGVTLTPLMDTIFNAPEGELTDLKTFSKDLPHQT